jgi:hypothetical protein
MGAAPGGDGDFAEAFGTFLRGGVGGLVAPVHAGYQCVHGDDYEEVDGGCNQEKGHAGIDEVADGKWSAVERECDVGKIWLADEGGDEGRKQVLGEGGDYAAEGRADNNADGHVHDVAAKDEFFEAAEHAKAP